MQVALPWKRPQEGETPVARDQELSLQSSTAVHCGPSCQGSGALTTLRCQGSLHQSKFSSLKSRSFSSRRQPIFSHAVAILAVQWIVFISVQNWSIISIINLIIVAFIRFCALSHLSLLSSAFGNPGLVSWRGKDQEAILAYDISLRAPRYKVGRYQIWNIQQKQFFRSP